MRIQPKKKRHPQDVLGLEGTFKDYIRTNSLNSVPIIQSDTLYFTKRILDLRGCQELVLIDETIKFAVIFDPSCFPSTEYCEHVRQIILSRFEFKPAPVCTCTIGADPEFEVYGNNKILNASDAYISKSNHVGLDGSGFQIELRPAPAETPEELLNNIREALVEYYHNNKYNLCLSGHVYPLGFHLHAAWESSCDSNDAWVISKQADRFLGHLFIHASGRARGNYKKLCQYRCNSAPYNGRQGMEYRSLPSIIAFSEKHLLLILKVWKLLVDKVIAGEEFPDNSKASEEEYTKLGLSMTEVQELFAYARLLKKIAEVGENIPLQWNIELSFKIEVDFNTRDTFIGTVTQFFSNSFKKVTTKTKIRVRFFGFAQSRGNVSNIPVADWQLLDKDFPVVTHTGREVVLNIGLPYEFRTNEEFFNRYKNAVLDSVMKLIEEVDKNVPDSGV
jgi:hypothetical protein